MTGYQITIAVDDHEAVIIQPWSLLLSDGRERSKSWFNYKFTITTSKPSYQIQQARTMFEIFFGVHAALLILVLDNHMD